MTRSRRSRASNAASLIVRVPVASGGVRPVVLVVDPVRLIELDGEVGGRRPERALPCLALLPDEASGQIDVDDVVLARDRVLQSITAALAHAVDAKRALAPAALDGDLLFQESDDLEGRSEQLPRHPTELPGEDLGQRLDLLVGGGGVDDKGGLAVALMNRLGPHEDPGALHAGEGGVAAAPPRHREADERAPAAVRRIRDAAGVDSGRTSMAEPGTIKGEYLENCNCEVLCPCLLGPQNARGGAMARPTEGTCDVPVVFAIERGRCGAVALDGTHAALVVHTPG